MLGLQGKTAFVFGVASEDSIAWAICKQLAAAGVTLYLGYQKRFMSRVFKLKDQLPAIGGFYPLDVASDATTQEFFTAFAAEHPGKKQTFWFTPSALPLGRALTAPFSSWRTRTSTPP